MKRFNSIEELIDNISKGGEIEFCYKENYYSITHTSEGIHIMEFYNYTTEKIYKSANEIIKYKIDGKDLGMLINDINITFRCF